MLPDNVRELCENLKYHRYCYYEKNAPEISDVEYDALYAEFLKYKEIYPELEDVVGYPTVRANTKHKRRMLSLRSTRDITSIPAMFKKFKGNVSCEPKLDGLSLELIYHENKLVAAVTRGDGDSGENVIHNASRCRSIAQTISEGYDAQIYGELYINRCDLATINGERIAQDKEPYANTRNAVSGIIRSNDAGNLTKYLSFFPYTVYGVPTLRTQNDMFVWLKKQGFISLIALIENLSDEIALLEYYKKMTDIRYSLPFDIDGLVFKVDDVVLRESIGESATHPHWAIAYKFAPERVESVLREILFQVGKSGIIAPVAVFDEVVLRTSKVSRASLSNSAVIREKDIRIGDTIIIEMANDVIPYIAGVVQEKRDGKEIPVVFPDRCPSCGGPVEIAGAHYVCHNTECKSQLVGKLIAAVSRKGLNLKGLGKILIGYLFEYGIVEDVADLYRLSHPQVIERLTSELKLGEKVINNIARELRYARKIPLHRFIYALGIRDVSVMTANKLAQAFGSIEALLYAIHTGQTIELANTNAQTIENIREYFRSDYFQQLLEKFKSLGVEVQKYEKSNHEKIVITGALSESRRTFEEKLEHLGYQCGSTLTKDTTYLVYGTAPSQSKLDLAIQYNIRTMNEKEFRETILRE